MSTCNILNHKMAKWHFMLQRINPNEVLWRLFQMRLPRIIGFKAKKLSVKSVVNPSHLSPERKETRWFVRASFLHRNNNFTSKSCCMKISLSYSSHKFDFKIVWLTSYKVCLTLSRDYKDVNLFGRIKTNASSCCMFLSCCCL